MRTIPMTSLGYLVFEKMFLLNLHNHNWFHRFVERNRDDSDTAI